MRSDRVVALVMAAGQSRRFGSDKRQARLPDGRALLAATVVRVMTVWPRVRVVLRVGDDPAELGLTAATPVLTAADAEAGLGSSLGDAFTALRHDTGLDDCRVAAVVLGDMPRVRAETLAALQREAGTSRILRPCQAGRPGHPVLFGRDLWPALAGLRGEGGARGVIRRHAASYRELEVADPGIHADVDTPGDLASCPCETSPSPPW